MTNRPAFTKTVVLIIEYCILLATKGFRLETVARI
jgi:hypothetical protein